LYCLTSASSGLVEGNTADLEFGLVAGLQRSTYPKGALSDQ
jgi:hypothetical protein